MKVEEVPQDEKYYKGTDVRDVCYALDENGNYQQVMSTGWNAKNEALSLTWESITEEAEEIRQEVLAGKKSPLAFYMKVHLFTLSILSSYTDIPKRIIKKHITAKGFENIEESYILKYAEALGITPEELTNFGK